MGCMNTVDLSHHMMFITATKLLLKHAVNSPALMVTDDGILAGS